MARPEKVAEVQAITEKMKAAQSIVLADFSGLTVLQMSAFRTQCREKSVECRVAKNRLARIACDNAGVEVIKDILKGPTAFIFAPESQVDAAKLTVEFAKENEAMEIKGGVVDGQYLDAKQIVALSKVPTYDELIAKMMGSINSPARGIAATIIGVSAALVRTINAVAEQKAPAAE